jgi:hypothetical protein
MVGEHSPVSKRRSVTRWVCIGGAIVLAIIVGALAFLAIRWPFTRASVIQALESASGQHVEIRTFSRKYVPVGFSAEGIQFFRGSNAGDKPLITVEKLSLETSLAGLLASPKRIALIRVVGLHVVIPPTTNGGGGGKIRIPLNSGSNGAVVIAKIVADGALLKVLPKESTAKPYVLKVDRLALTNVGEKTRMAYAVTLVNTEPPGVIHAEGKFGPWDPDKIDATGVSGRYTYDDIDLNALGGVGGKAHAQGEFTGGISRIHTNGSIEAADFRVASAGHPVRLSVSYQATVNAMNGDVLLEPAIARYRGTRIEARGWIAARRGQKGKTAALDVAVPEGRIDDLLYLFTTGRPGMSGPVAIHGTFLWPPGPRKFLEKIRMNLNFGINGSRFMSSKTQDSIDRLSESAQGENKKERQEDPRTMLAVLQGHINVRDGVAVVSDVRAHVPGADATIAGDYNLVNERVDLHGTLDTRGHLSATTSGFKAVVLKALSPFLEKKKGPLRIVPFRITGAYGHTSVGIDWKRNLLRSAE